MTVSEALGRAGVRSTPFYVTSLASIGLCIGLWPPMFWLMGDSLKATE